MDNMRTTAFMFWGLLSTNNIPKLSAAVGRRGGTTNKKASDLPTYLPNSVNALSTTLPPFPPIKPQMLPDYRLTIPYQTHFTYREQSSSLKWGPKGQQIDAAPCT